MSDSAAAFVHLMLFLGGAVVWAVVVGTGLVALDLDAERLTGAQTGVVFTLALGGLATWTTLLASLLGLVSWFGRPSWPIERLALRRPTVRWAGLSLLAGMYVWTMPTWLVTEFSRRMGIDSPVLENTARMMLEGPVFDRVGIIVAVVVVAPLAEELVFRGYLFEVLRRSGGARFAWILSTVIFALYHADPVQSVAVIPAGALLGWVRWRSGSVVASMLAHAGNNLGAVVAVLILHAAGLESLSLPIAVAGAALAVVCCWRAASSPTPPHGALP